MHSSRMLNACSLPYAGVSLTETPQTETPQTETPPDGQTPRHRHPPPRDRPPGGGQTTPAKTLPSQTSLAGGKDIGLKFAIFHNSFITTVIILFDKNTFQQKGRFIQRSYRNCSILVVCSQSLSECSESTKGPMTFTLTWCVAMI